MAEGQLAYGGKQAAWMIVRGGLANALTNSARACPSEVYVPLAPRVRGSIRAVAFAVAGHRHSTDGDVQLFLRREQGGMDVQDLLQSAVRARAIGVMERGPTLRAALGHLHPQSEEADRMNAAQGMHDAAEIFAAGAGNGHWAARSPQTFSIFAAHPDVALRPSACSV